MGKRFLVLIAVIFLLVSGNLGAMGPKHGAELLIQKRDGQDVRGELIAIKQNSLLLLESESSADVSVGVSDIEVIIFENKPKVMTRAGLGLLIGASAGVLLGFMYGSDEPGGIDEPDRVSRSASKKALTLGAFFGLLGTLGGGIAGGLEGSDEIIFMEGKSESEVKEVLEELRSKARFPDHR